MDERESSQGQVNEALRANLEALLFVSEEPQHITRLADAIPDATREQIQEAVDQLIKEYASERYGIQLVEIAGGYQMCTKSSYAASINKLFEKRRRRSLSKPALETLAIIAYKQPITRAEVEIIRGVNVDGAVHTLLERHLIKISGRKDVPGRPFLYRTTKSFLQYFGLKSLADLPKVEDVTLGLQPPADYQEQPEFWDNMDAESAPKELIEDVSGEQETEEQHPPSSSPPVDTE